MPAKPASQFCSWGPDYLISFQESDAGRLWRRWRSGCKNPGAASGATGWTIWPTPFWTPSWTITFVALEHMGDEVEDIEEDLLDRPSPGHPAASLHQLRREEAVSFRKAIWPLREVVNFLERGESELVQHSTLVYLRDVYDHLIQVMDAVETMRDLLAGMLDIYLSSVSNRMNEVMKVLTIIATLFIPLTFLAGLYGMNFKHMPELEWPWAYPAVLIIMMISAYGHALLLPQEEVALTFVSSRLKAPFSRAFSTMPKAGGRAGHASTGLSSPPRGVRLSPGPCSRHCSLNTSNRPTRPRQAGVAYGQGVCHQRRVALRQAKAPAFPP